MSNEPLYRRVPEDGKHPARSRKNPGAISGAALDDRANKPSGFSDFMPVKMSEEEYLREQRKAAFVINLVDIVSPKIERWWYTKALPSSNTRLFPQPNARYPCGGAKCGVAGKKSRFYRNDKGQTAIG